MGEAPLGGDCGVGWGWGEVRGGYGEGRANDMKIERGWGVVGEKSVSLRESRGRDFFSGEWAEPRPSPLLSCKSRPPLPPASLADQSERASPSSLKAPHTRSTFPESKCIPSFGPLLADFPTPARPPFYLLPPLQPLPPVVAVNSAPLRDASFDPHPKPLHFRSIHLEPFQILGAWFSRPRKGRPQQPATCNLQDPGEQYKCKT